MIRMSIWFAAILVAGGVLCGCAQYSACVKAQMGPAIKAITLQTVESQVAAVLATAASQQWVATGLQALEYACADTNCKALVSCAATAWAEAHPSAKPAVNGVQQYKSASAIAKTAALTCRPSPKAESASDALGIQVLALTDIGATVTVASNADGDVEMSAYTP